MAHVLVTGASSGLGEALAVELGRRGHALGLIARRADELERVAGAVRAAGGTAVAAVADVTDRAALEEAVRRCEAALGPVDVLVANAGGGGPMPVGRFDPERAALIMRLNYDGVLNALGAVLPAMLARGGGHVAAVSSVAAWRGIAPGGPYSAAKAAVTTLLEAMAVELRPKGIAVTTIHPGFVATPLTAGAKNPMPFLVSADVAARVMADGLLARRREVNFPLRMVALMTLVRALPGWVFERALYRALPTKLRE